MGSVEPDRAEREEIPGNLDRPEGAPAASRHDLQLGRRLFHLGNGVAVATAYALLFTHQQVVHLFGTIACVVYILDRIRIAYPEVVARRAPLLNRLFVRAEEQVRESAMIPFVIAVLLAILTVPKRAALVGIYTLAIADPLAAVIGIRFGKHKISQNRSLEGSLAFFVATFAIAAAVFSWQTITPSLPIVAAAGVIALLSTVGEALPVRIDDNLTIPLFVSFLTWITASALTLPLG